MVCHEKGVVGAQVRQMPDWDVGCAAFEGVEGRLCGRGIGGFGKGAPMGAKSGTMGAIRGGICVYGC